ncbi:hypothetical protein BSKO_04505 [Bryopsis sp. KO-2023]|nr:hypothetical protein BSKO_04505 [Bryopsis sp. KO-2023]
MMSPAMYLPLILLVGGAFAKPNCPFYSTKVGDFTLTVISDGTTIGSVSDLVPTTPALAVTKAANSHFVGTEGSPLHYNPVHLETGDMKVLFDTGSAHHFGPTLGKLLENMGAAGLDPNEVDAVVISHVHIDHIGGLLRLDGSLAFPNADYYVGRVEYEFWKDASLESSVIAAWGIPDDVKMQALDLAKESLKLMRDRLTLFEFGEEILPGVTAKALDGHTPGHTGYVIKSGEESFLFAGDAVLIDFINVEHPEWKVLFDMNATKAIDTRFKLLGELADTGMETALYHNGFPGVGHVYRDGKGYAFRPVRYEL